jgi:hypothetical protein
MSDGFLVAAALLVLLAIVPALLGLLFTTRADRPKAEALLSADHARARATLAYYNEVHDSHSG